MSIKVTGRKMQVSDALHAYAEEKVENSMKVFEIGPMNAEVVLHVEKNRSNPKSSVAEITLRTKGQVIRAEEAAEDMYAAIDLASSKINRQLRKFKTKVIDRRKRAGEKPVAQLEPVPVDIAAAPEDDDAIVRVKYIDLQPLTEEEALIQTDLVGHDFFMYIDAVTGLTNVIYHRKGGGYGVLKPKVEEDAEA